MTQYEPGRIYICLRHPHPGHYYLTPQGNWRFYHKRHTQWYKRHPDQENCSLVIFDDPRDT